MRSSFPSRVSDLSSASANSILAKGVLAVAALLLILPTWLLGANGVWNGSTSTSWTLAGNWTGGVPQSGTSTADFSSSAVPFLPTTPAGGLTIGELQFDNTLTGAFTINGTGNLISLKAAGTLAGTGILDNSNFLVTINPNISLLTNAQTWSTAGSSGGGLLVNGTVALAKALTLDTSSSSSITLSNVVSGASPLVITGSGTTTLSGLNIYTGATTINGGTLSVNSIANTSTSSALGAPTTVANGTIAIGSTTTGATLQYTGSTNASTNRVIDLTGTTGGATLDSSGTGTVTFTSAFTATGAGSKTLTLTGSNTGANTISGAIVNNSGTNLTSVNKTGAGEWVLSGTNTYSGATTIDGGILSVGTLANGGSNSDLGSSSNAATNLVLNGGTLNYTGAGVTTDRLFSVGTSGGTIDSSGSGALNFSNTGSMGFNSQTGTRTLTLTGTNTNANTIAAIIGDNTGATSPR